MDKFIFNKYNGKNFLWNYNHIIKEKKMNDNDFFITNNFIERSNRTLNENLIYKKSSFVNFRNCLLDTDIYFSIKREYNFSNPNLSKAFLYYIKNCNYIDKKTHKIIIINMEKLKDIYNTYIKVVKNA